MHISISNLCLVATIALLSLSGTANAGLFRAYLSGNGKDAYPCTVSQPCRLLPAALAAVNPGGEIWIVDSANFNTAPVNIDRSVTILAVPGVLGSVVGSGGDAIVINAAGVDVTLRNLKVLNLSGGVNGINMTNGNSLTVDGCEIVGFGAGTGIYAKTTGTVAIIDTIVRNNHDGIWFDGGATGIVLRATVLRNQQIGIQSHPTVNSTVTVTVNDSVSSNNGWGYVATGSVNRIGKMFVTRSAAANNVYDGFGSDGTGTALMVVSGSSATGNRYGFDNFAGTFRSLGDNTVNENSYNDTIGAITLISPK